MAKIPERLKLIKRRRGVRWTNSLIAAMDGIPSRYKQIRGFAAEDKAFSAAKYWQKKKIILAVRKTEGLGVEDMGMIDLVLTLRNKQEVRIQVKNYCNLEVVRKCRERGVSFFFIGPEEDGEIAIERMRDLIISAYISAYKLTPFQIRQLISQIQETKEPPPLPPSLITRIIKRARRVF